MARGNWRNWVEMYCKSCGHRYYKKYIKKPYCLNCLYCDGKGIINYVYRLGNYPCPKCKGTGKIYICQCGRKLTERED